MEAFPVTTVIDATIKFIRHHKIHLVKKVVFYNIEWRQYVFVISDRSVTKFRWTTIYFESSLCQCNGAYLELIE
ncbi:hypothetical protein WUBG_18921 [Wuchereria bancrofti]|nr:hypothetical protein WUBG_18921 [Wuchereria bancrofti]